MTISIGSYLIFKSNFMDYTFDVHISIEPNSENENKWSFPTTNFSKALMNTPTMEVSSYI